MREFLHDLFDHGRVRVAEKASGDWQCDRELAEFERIRRQEFPGNAPEFLPHAAAWAARLFHRACQATVFRDQAADTWRGDLEQACPAGERSALHYSVDLVFQYLPDLWILASPAGVEDPLVAILQRWNNAWPLSSIGIAGVVPTSLAGIVDHPGLLQHYVDRVIARRDASRLSDPFVLSSVRRAFGLHASRLAEWESALTHVR